MYIYIYIYIYIYRLQYYNMCVVSHDHTYDDDEGHFDSLDPGFRYKAPGAGVTLLVTRRLLHGRT